MEAVEAVELRPSLETKGDDDEQVDVEEEVELGDDGDDDGEDSAGGRELLSLLAALGPLPLTLKAFSLPFFLLLPSFFPTEVWGVVLRVVSVCMLLFICVGVGDEEEMEGGEREGGSVVAVETCGRMTAEVTG